MYHSLIPATSELVSRALQPYMGYTDPVEGYRLSISINSTARAKYGKLIAGNSAEDQLGLSRAGTLACFDESCPMLSVEMFSG